MTELRGDRRPPPPAAPSAPPPAGGTGAAPPPRNAGAEGRRGRQASNGPPGVGGPDRAAHAVEGAGGERHHQ